MVVYTSDMLKNVVKLLPDNLDIIDEESLLKLFRPFGDTYYAEGYRWVLHKKGNKITKENVLDAIKAMKV